MLFLSKELIFAIFNFRYHLFLPVGELKDLNLSKSQKYIFKNGKWY